MGKIFKISFDMDCGELWLDEKLKPLAWVDAQDASFQNDYHGFIFKALGVKLIDIYIEPSETQIEEFPFGQPQEIFDMFESQIKEI